MAIQIADERIEQELERLAGSQPARTSKTGIVMAILGRVTQMPTDQFNDWLHNRTEPASASTN